MIDWNTVLVATIPGTIAAIIGFFLGKRERNKKIDTSIIEDVQKITDIQKGILDNSEAYWKKRFEDHEKDCQESKERLRSDLALTLVENSTLKEKIAEQSGYIQGVKETSPLIKLEKQQQEALRAGRRTTDK